MNKNNYLHIIGIILICLFNAACQISQPEDVSTIITVEDLSDIKFDTVVVYTMYDSIGYLYSDSNEVLFYQYENIGNVCDTVKLFYHTSGELYGLGQKCSIIPSKIVLVDGQLGYKLFFRDLVENTDTLSMSNDSLRRIVDSLLNIPLEELK
jgi:hypothetical protein